MPSADTPDKSRASSRSHILWSCVRLGGALALVGLAVRHVTSADHGALPWHSVNPGWLLVSLVLALVSVVGWWLRWLLFLRLFGVAAGAGEVFWLTWMADFFNYFIFGALAADGFRVAMMARRHPGRLGPIAASIAFDHIAGLLASAIFFFAFTLPGRHWMIERGGAAIQGCLWTAGIALGLLGFFSFTGVMATQIQKNWVARLTRRWPSISARAVTMLEEFRELRRRSGLARLGLLASLLCLAASYAAFGAAARAWGSAIPWTHFFAVLPVVDALSALPVTVQGLGIREQIFLAVFPEAGAAEHARVLAISLTGFAVQSLWAMLGGVLLAWKSLPGFSSPVSANTSS